MKKNALLIFVAAWLLSMILTSSAFGCVCTSPSVCEAYSLAERVFIGRLVSKETRDENGREVIIAKFKSGKVFKGDSAERVKVVAFSGGGCEPTLLVGEKYIVFDIRSSRVNSLICNPTRLLSEAAPFVKYAKYASEHRDIFTISGKITGLQPSSLSRVSIKLLNNGRETVLKLNADGEYFAHIKGESSYNLQITFPKAVTGSFNRLASSKWIDGESIDFSGTASDGACDYRRISVVEQ